MERESFPSQTIKCDSFASDRNGMPELHSTVIGVTRSTVNVLTGRDGIQGVVDSDADLNYFHPHYRDEKDIFDKYFNLI